VRRLRFPLIVVAAGLACWAAYRDAVLGPLVGPLQAAAARVTAGLVRALGTEAAVAGTVVYHPGGFAFQVSRGCLGLVPLVLLATGIVAFPAPGRRKLWGLLAGLPVLAALNLVRLAQLFLTGVRWPGAFDVVHEVVWQVVVVGAALGIWLAWVRWVDRRREPLAGPAGAQDRGVRAARRGADALRRRDGT
jgi:exosortase H (IPTLxxWG-CTERM-specific)